MHGERERTRFVTHKGTNILYMDFTNVQDSGEAIRHIEAAKAVVATQPARSLRVLVNVSGSHFDTSVSQAMKEFAAHNKPYVIASCVVGMTGLMKVVLTAVRTFTKRNIQSFPTEEQAKDWLVEQS